MTTSNPQPPEPPRGRWQKKPGQPNVPGGGPNFRSLIWIIAAVTSALFVLWLLYTHSVRYVVGWYLERQPVYQAIFTDFPEWHREQFITDYVPSFLPFPTPGRLDGKRWESYHIMSVHHLPHYILKAPDSAVMNFYRARNERDRAILEAGVKRCYDYMLNTIEFDNVRRSVGDTVYVAYAESIRDLILDADAYPQRPASWDQLRTDYERAGEKALSAEYRQNRTVYDHFRQRKLSSDCIREHQVSNTILSLPEHQAANAVRYIYGRKPAR